MRMEFHYFGHIIVIAYVIVMCFDDSAFFDNLRSSRPVGVRFSARGVEGSLRQSRGSHGVLLRRCGGGSFRDFSGCGSSCGLHNFLMG